jgi:RimJ/RimL family protein N-acetyltransferase
LKKNFIPEKNIIITPNLIIKDFNKKLVNKRYVKWLNDEKVNKFIINKKSKTKKKDIFNYLKSLDKKKNIFLSVHLKKKNIHIGNIRLKILFKKKYLYFSILIGNPKYHNKGFGSESLKYIIIYCKNILKLKKILVKVYKKNIPAIKIYKKNKMKFIKKINNLKNGNFVYLGKKLC